MLAALRTIDRFAAAILGGFVFAYGFVGLATLGGFALGLPFFEAWSLTPAEADIAGLLLKGASLREIAALRRTSEATIRQQAQSVYRKSGLGGRRELAAYFLEALFERRSAVEQGTKPWPDDGPSG